MSPLFVMGEYASEADLNKAEASYYGRLAKTFAANVDNQALTDEAFRQFVRNCVSEFRKKES